ncbi:unnamed protein product [Oncorhynchus mykiss]|uniref:Kelch domain-containing protein 2 n=1 Tax=Oncorhynchus mykiss TaxID=8022 RepID=A0A060XFV5_ONCMY|nr:unnamed protein product [Oncorhynchus mykiss]
MAEMEEDIPDPLPVEEDEELERDEEEGEFDWVVDEADELDDEDVVVLDTEAESFELEQPAERSGHIAAVDGHYMYVWGGYKNSQTTGFFDLYLPRNEIWIYNMETERWKKQMTAGNLHTSMSGSCGVCVDGVLYLFGGHHARGNTDRVFRLPLRTPALCWEEMKDLKGLAPLLGPQEQVRWPIGRQSVPQQGPVGRSWHSLTPVSPDHIFLFGGFTTSRETLSDAWLYCVSKNEWQQFKHNHTESPRLWHTACSGPGGEVFVFGGCANNLLSHQRAAHSKELLVFTVQPKSLVRFCMEAALQHRELLSGSWDCLPKHLLHTLRQRMGGINALGS